MCGPDEGLFAIVVIGLLTIVLLLRNPQLSVTTEITVGPQSFLVVELRDWLNHARKNVNISSCLI